MSALLVETSRFVGERQIRDCLNHDTKISISYKTDAWESINGSVMGVADTYHEALGIEGKIKIEVNSTFFELLQQGGDVLNICNSLRLILVAYSSEAGISRVLVDKPLSELNSAGGVFSFDKMADLTLDPMRARTIGMELYVSTPRNSNTVSQKIPELLPIWRRNWIVKIQKNKGKWSVSSLTPEVAARYSIPEGTFLYSDLDRLTDGDADYEEVKFYLNEKIFAVLENLPSGHRYMLMRAYFSEVVSHLGKTARIVRGEHSLLRTMWERLEVTKPIDDYLGEGGLGLTTAGQSILLGHIDAMFAVADNVRSGLVAENDRSPDYPEEGSHE